jgi:hypothetical protein
MPELVADRRELTALIGPDPASWAVAGDGDGIARHLDAASKPFYVYVLRRPCGEPFYVGKGVSRRVLQHEADARNTTQRSHKLNVIRALHRAGLRPGYAIAGWFDVEADALACERQLIQTIGRHDLGTGPLTNQTDGGEGTSNPSAESRARRAATLGGDAEEPDRRAINEFFHSIAGQQDSVPIKPLGARRLERSTPHPSKRRPQPRMAVALVAALAAIERPLTPGALIPRCFSLGGRSYVIENGVARDMLKAGMIELQSGALRPEDEVFRLTDIGLEAVLEFVGRDRLVDLGVCDPD